MVTIRDVCMRVCTHHPPLIAVSRHKDVKTAIKYLSSAYGTTPEKLILTPAIESSYREVLRTYCDQHPKGQSTIRNTFQYLAQLLKAFHTLEQTAQVPRQAPLLPGVEVVRRRLGQESPYRHLRWLQRSGRYWIPFAQWPEDIKTHWDAFTRAYARDMRWATFDNYEKSFGYYVSYHLMSPEARLSAMPAEAQAKLQEDGKYAHWRLEIIAPPIATSWDALFEPAQINSFITWSAWRVWRWHDDILKEKEPHRPSSRGKKLADIMLCIANRTGHPKKEEVHLLNKKLPAVLRMHDKADPRHRFELSELEAVALELIAEARRMEVEYTNPRTQHPGMNQALRFQLGLILQLAWRNPMRARNWCEAL
jgi:hypothetical protein